MNTVATSPRIHLNNLCSTLKAKLPNYYFDHQFLSTNHEFTISLSPEKRKSRISLIIKTFTQEQEERKLVHIYLSVSSMNPPLNVGLKEVKLEAFDDDTVIEEMKKMMEVKISRFKAESINTYCNRVRGRLHTISVESSFYTRFSVE
jgi:hypothetical protein